MFSFTGNPLCVLGELYLVVIFARIILSWFPITPGSGLASVFSFLYTVTEPVLGPVRRLVPSSGMGIDFSPIIVLLGFRLIVLPAVCRAF